MQVHHALRELGLRDVVVEVQDVERGLRIEAQRSRSDFHFGATSLIGKEFVAGAKRPVQIGLDPIVIAGRLKADVSAQIAQSGDTVGWIVLSALRIILRENRTSGRKERQSEHGEHRLADGTTRCAHVWSLLLPTPTRGNGGWIPRKGLPARG